LHGVRVAQTGCATPLIGDTIHATMFSVSKLENIRAFRNWLSGPMGSLLSRYQPVNNSNNFAYFSRLNLLFDKLHMGSLTTQFSKSMTQHNPYEFLRFQQLGVLRRAMDIDNLENLYV